jgi:hypothetical protein
MFWNRKEVFMGSSMQRLSEVRSILSTNKIKYEYKVVSQNQGVSRGRMGTFGENVDYLNTYYVYVHNKDYANACSVL